VGAAVAKELLQAGYKVRAPIRNVDKGQLISEVFHKDYGTDAFSTILINDMAEPGTFTQAMEGCSGVAHVASPASFSGDPNEVITPAVDIVKNLLSTAAKTSSVKRFVFTSTQAALPSLHEPGTITGSSWRPGIDAIIKEAWEEPHSPAKGSLVYLASKICSEKVCWDFIEQEKPDFVLNTVVVSVAIGEVIHPQLLSTSNWMIFQFLNSHPTAVGFLKWVSPSCYINLEDAGLLHLASLTVDHVRGQRLLALGEVFDFNSLRDLLQRLVPENNLPAKIYDMPTFAAKVDTTLELELMRLFGREGFKGLEESIRLCLTTGASWLPVQGDKRPGI
jgi:nucleoside-diphosphate-sugar epimerase